MNRLSNCTSSKAQRMTRPGVVQTGLLNPLCLKIQIGSYMDPQQKRAHQPAEPLVSLLQHFLEFHLPL